MIYYIRTFEGVRVAGWGDCRVDSPRTRRVTGFRCARVRLNRFLLDSWWLSALGVASLVASPKPPGTPQRVGTAQVICSRELKAGL
jgi:hypothetical protein